jgi:hypothetical protein
MAKAMHRNACRNQPTWQPFPPVSSPACIVYARVCVYIPVHKSKWRQYVLRFHKHNISLNKQTGLTDFIHQIVVEIVSRKQFFSDMPMHSRSKQTPTLLWRFFRLLCTILDFTSQTHPQMAAPVHGSLHRYSSVNGHRCRAGTTTKNMLGCTFFNLLQTKRRPL